jgi:hypothetical protein
MSSGHAGFIDLESGPLSPPAITQLIPDTSEPGSCNQGRKFNAPKSGSAEMKRTITL